MIPGVDYLLVRALFILYWYSQIFSLTAVDWKWRRGEGNWESGNQERVDSTVSCFHWEKNGDSMEVHHTQFSDTDVARLYWFVILMKTTRTRHVVELQK